MQNIYLDNAATSFPKAPGVGDALKRYIDEVGVNVNRSAYRSTVDAAMDVLEVRRLVADFFGFRGDCSHVVFTANITMSLNMLMKGFLHPGDHLIISGMEHNAVARPANQLREAGVDVTVAPCRAGGLLDFGAFRGLFRGNTRLVVMQAASNVSGTIQDVAAITGICHRHGALFVLDSAQAAGHYPLSMEALSVDALAFTGHKGLLGPNGIGGFLLNDAFDQALSPLLSGGTGSLSASLDMPRTLPDRFEAGTPNLPGIMGLGTALRFLMKTGIPALRAREIALTGRMMDGFRSVRRLRIPGPDDPEKRVGVVSVDLEGVDPAELAFRLEHEFGILVRCGLHCAPLAHRSLGTYPNGLVRFSVGYATKEEEVDAAVDAVRSVAASR